jgi:enamine deaminase RidA (YjgF/YER057c/UK114 family)
MNILRGIGGAAAAAFLWLGLAVLAAAAELTSVAPDPASGSSQAVIVERSPLVFTEQLMPRDAQGQIPDGADGQVRALLDRLKSTLSAAGSSLDRAAKLNFYVATDELSDRIRGELALRCRDAKLLPAVSFVQTRLPELKALVAVDAVACTDDAAVRQYVGRPAAAKSPFSILPQWPIVFISGDAKPGDLPVATTATLESLAATCKSLSTVRPIERDQIVQVKCFFQPMSRAAEVRRSIDAFFSPRPTPPVVMVEWTMKGPIEIECIADGTPGPLRINPGLWGVNFYTPPGMKPSPVFSRVALVNAPKLIFISGLYAADAGDGAAQVTSIFDQLGKLLPRAGSDFRHLAKATYYVSNEDASTQLNMLRPKYYDPARPPAASKAPVAGVAKLRRTITLDMIAVPPVSK